MKRIVGLSGGGDSQACLAWVLERFPAEDVVAVFADTGNEHPITIDHVRWISENVHPVETVRPIVADMAGRNPGKIRELGLSPDDPLTFDVLATIKGRYPSTKVRFCTTHLKLEPQRRWAREAIASGRLEPRGYERFVGVRRDESEARADVLETEWDDYFDCWLHRPIAAWSKPHTFDFLNRLGQEINPLYTLGFGRVGCAPCINSTKSDVRNWAARFPEMIDKVRTWERNTGRTFFPPCVPGKEINWVDEVVAWSRTSRGGRHADLGLYEADVKAGICMSLYGLCE